MNILSVNSIDNLEYRKILDDLKRTLDYNDISYEIEYDRLGFECSVIVQPKDLLEILNYMSQE